MKDFSIAKFEFELEAIDDLNLPPYKGSTIRGALGHAFRRVCCAEKRRTCDECPLKMGCGYAYVFQTPPPRDTRMMRLYPEVPHPFVIEPPLTDETYLPAGSCFCFGLVLVGRAIDYAPYFLYAFREMGEKGIGKARGRYRLSCVRAMDSGTGTKDIYSSRNPERIVTDFAVLTDFTWHDKIPIQLTLQFLTPVRIRFGERLSRNLPFHVLVRSLLRRISALSYFHCGRELNVDFKALIEAAASVETVHSDLRWRDWERYSSRQGTRMALGGLVGRVTYSGDLCPFLRFLHIGQHVHAGKATSFGLGKYEILG